jgi:hypothetical protein
MPDFVQTFTKKPVEVRAARWQGGAAEAGPTIDWILNSGGTARYHEEVTEEQKVWDPDGKSYTILPPEPEHIAIDTLEGTMRAHAGDWIVQGVEGEFYSVKHSIFIKTYDRSFF